MMNRETGVVLGVIGMFLIIAGLCLAAPGKWVIGIWVNVRHDVRLNNPAKEAKLHGFMWNTNGSLHNNPGTNDVGDWRPLNYSELGYYIMERCGDRLWVPYTNTSDGLAWDKMHIPRYRMKGRLSDANLNYIKNVIMNAPTNKFFIMKEWDQ